MGNRAVITTSVIGDAEVKSCNNVGLYLHWYGGKGNVEAFLLYCKLRGFRPPEQDSYGWARLAQIVGNFMGGDGLSVGIDTCNRLDCDNWDNGVYIIKDWKIVGRKYFDGVEQELEKHDLIDMLVAIDKAQPRDQRLKLDDRFYPTEITSSVNEEEIEKAVSMLH